MHYILLDSTRTNHIKIVSQVRLENYIKFINESNYAKNYSHYAHPSKIATLTIHQLFTNYSPTIHNHSLSCHNNKNV